MVYRVGENSIVYRVIKVEGLPHPVFLVRDPKRGGFTAYMKAVPEVIAEGETVNEAINSLKSSYKTVLRVKEERDI